MKRLPFNPRTLKLAAVLIPLLVVFVYVGLRSGPLAPVPVTTTTVARRSLAPSVFGIGTVEARYTFKVGPVVPGRIKAVCVDVGDRVKAGQLLGEMDPVDLDDRIRAQDAALQRAEASVHATAAQIREASARTTYAVAQAGRYTDLRQAGSASEEALDAKVQERQLAEAGGDIARANQDVARREVARIRSEREALIQQRNNLRLVAPSAGLVTGRNAEPGTTVLAGQAIIELIDHTQLWIDVRIDQLHAAGVRAGLPATLTLRSGAGQQFAGRVLRIEPQADAVTEELLAKVVFDQPPELLPAVGELAEATVQLAKLDNVLAVPSASVQRVNGAAGVWLVDNNKPRFARVTTGAADPDGWVQILDGVDAGQRVIVYSQRAIKDGSRIKVVERLPGVSP